MAKYIIIASLKSETVDKLINRILDQCLLISSLPCKVLRTLVEACRAIQQAFSKLSLVKLISKDTHFITSESNEGSGEPVHSQSGLPLRLAYTTYGSRGRR